MNDTPKTETNSTTPEASISSDLLDKLKNYALELEALLPPVLAIKWDHNGSIYMERSGRGRDVRIKEQEALQLLMTARRIVESMVSV